MNEVEAVARAIDDQLTAEDGWMVGTPALSSMCHDFAQAAIAALDAAREKEELVARALTDPQRMLWKDDVEGICLSVDLCFEYGDTTRCWPCAAKQSASLGIAVDTSQPALPEVARLRRELKAQGDRVAQVVEWLRKENGLCDCHARCETECGCGAWDDWKTKPLLEIADAIERGEPFNG